MDKKADVHRRSFCLAWKILLRSGVNMASMSYVYMYHRNQTSTLRSQSPVDGRPFDPCTLDTHCRPTHSPAILRTCKNYKKILVQFGTWCQTNFTMVHVLQLISAILTHKKGKYIIFKSYLEYM